MEQAKPFRQDEILPRLGAGYSDKLMAKDLGISPRTIEAHVNSLKKMFGVETRNELISFAAFRNLITEEAVGKLVKERLSMASRHWAILAAVLIGMFQGMLDNSAEEEARREVRRRGGDRIQRVARNVPKELNDLALGFGLVINNGNEMEIQDDRNDDYQKAA